MLLLFFVVVVGFVLVLVDYVDVVVSVVVLVSVVVAVVQLGLDFKLNTKIVVVDTRNLPLKSCKIRSLVDVMMLLLLIP